MFRAAYISIKNRDIMNLEREFANTQLISEPDEIKKIISEMLENKVGSSQKFPKRLEPRIIK